MIIRTLLALLLLPFMASAAVPSFTSFIGTNGITVRSNVSTGKILIDGSGGSASNAQPPSAVLTNLSANANTGYTNIFLSTNCVVSDQLNTNTLIVTGAGTAGANGTYQWIGANGRYEKTTFNITYNGGDVYYYLSNGASQLYGNPVSADGNWSDVFSGAGPAPLVIFGPITNCFVTVTGGNYNFAMPNQNTNTLWVDNTFGNDTNGIRANPYFPFRTIQSAVNASRSGDTIKINRGLYTYTTLNSSNGLTFIGEGKGITVLGAASASSTIFNLASTNVLANMTVNGHIYLGNSGPGTTNSRIYNCEIFGTTDGILLTKWYDFRIEDSYIESPYDCFADFATNGTSVAIIKNCYIWSHNNGSGFSRGISGNCNRIEVYGGAIRSDYGNAQNACVYYDPELTKTNAIGSVLLSGVALIATNAGTLHVYSSNAPITFVGGIVNSNRLGGNGTFYVQGDILDNLTVRSNAIMKGQIYAPNMAGSGAFVGWDATTGQQFRTNAGSGTPGGTTGNIQFNQGGVFAGTNTFGVRRSDNTLIVTNNSSYAVEVGPNSITGFGDSDLYFGSFGVNYWHIQSGFGNLLPSNPGQVTIGSSGAPIGAVYASNTISVAGGGANGKIALSDNSRTNFQFEASPTMATDVVYRLPRNAMTGPVIAVFEGGKTNQMTNAPLGKAQVLSSDGTNYGAGPYSVTIDDTGAATNTAVQIDFGLPWSTYVILGGYSTNISLWVTNQHLAFAGRSISVEFPTNALTVALQVTNQAGQIVRYPPTVTTNGYPGFFKTNTSHFSLVFTMPQTNYPVVDACFYR